MIDAGRFNQRVTLQAPVATLDELGQPVDGWTEVDTVWAEANPTRSQELSSGGSTDSQIDVVFRVRYRTDITAAMRVVWRSTPYALIGDPVDVRGRREVLELNCASGPKAEV